MAELRRLTTPATVRSGSSPAEGTVLDHLDEPTVDLPIQPPPALTSWPVSAESPVDGKDSPRRLLLLGPRPLPRAPIRSSIDNEPGPVPVSQASDEARPAPTVFEVSTPTEYDAQIQVSSPLASSVGFPVSRNPSESARTVSDVVGRSSRSARSISVSTSMWSAPLTAPPTMPLPPTPSPPPLPITGLAFQRRAQEPSRYQNIQARPGQASYLPIASLGTRAAIRRSGPGALGTSPPSQAPTPRNEGGLVRSQPLSRDDRIGLVPSNTSAASPRLTDQEQSPISERASGNDPRSDELGDLGVPITSKYASKRFTLDTLSSTPYRGEFRGERRYTRELRTSMGPPTASSLSTFEIVEIPPQLPTIARDYVMRR